MKKTVSFIIFACIQALAGGFLQAQEDLLNRDPFVPSQQTYNFMRYGNTPVNHYDGTISLSIPISTYTDPDFTLPVSLGYISHGFKPQIIESCTGFNWFLNAGGIITRSVRGVPDDIHRTDTDLHSREFSYALSGFLKRRDHPEYFYDNEDFHLKNTHYLHFLGTPGINLMNYFSLFGAQIPNGTGQYAIETESDIYYFNFMGHKGSFILDGHCRPVVYGTRNAGEYKVDISDYTVGNNSTPVQSQITITTGDGYKYIFGGSAAYLGVFQTEYDGNDARILSWHLSKIIAPNNREVQFIYEGEAGSNYQRRSRQVSAMWEQIIGSDVGLRVETLNISDIGSTLSSVSYLTTIKVDNTAVFEFTYEGVAPNRKYLKTIDIKDRSGNIINHAALQYEAKARYKNTNTTESPDSLHFLAVLGLNDRGKFMFEYYHPSKYPGQNITSIDHWGFWNGGLDNSPANLVPDRISGKPLQDEYGNTYISETGKRAPSASYCNTGLLKKIVYPAGGYTEYQYEAHKYAKRLERTSAGSFGPALSDKTGTAGGARIAKITEYGSENEPAVQRTFVYSNDLNDQGPENSSGHLLVWPRYCFRLISSGSGNITFTVFQGRSVYENNMDGSYIEYAKVYEKFNDGSCIEYGFRNYRDSPDETDPQSLLTKQHPQVTISPESLGKNLFRPLNSCSSLRGLPSYKKYYSASGNLLKEEKYTYYEGKNTSLPAVTSPSLQGRDARIYSNYHYLYRTYTGTVASDSTIITEYRPEGNVRSVVKSAYNSAGQLKERLSRESSGAIRSIKNKYIADLNSLTDPVFLKMKESNYISLPLESISCLIPVNKSDTLVLSALLPVYTDTPASGIRLLKKQTYNPDTPVSLHSYRSMTEKTTETEEQYLYTSRGRIKEIQRRDGRAVSYVWGYRGDYPVAIIIGKKYSELILPSDYTPDSMDSSYYETVGTYIRNNNPGALVYTFTYKPQVGVISRTDPAGRTVRYAYDPVTNRLTQETDMDGNIIQSYQYNLMHQ